jgi:hypothetical protein
MSGRARAGAIRPGLGLLRPADGGDQVALAEGVGSLEGVEAGDADGLIDHRLLCVVMRLPGRSMPRRERPGAGRAASPLVGDLDPCRRATGVARSGGQTDAPRTM